MPASPTPPAAGAGSVVVVVLLTIGMGACGGSAPTPVTTPSPPPEPAVAELTADELASIVSGFRARIVRLNANIEACGRQRCVAMEGSLLVARSGALAAHLNGTSGAIEMASDGRMLHVRLGDVIEAEVHDALEMPVAGPSQLHLALAPLDLADALLPQIVSPPSADPAAVLVERRPDEVGLMLMTASPARLRRRVVFDPATGGIRRVERFDEAGLLRLVTSYEDWDPRRGPPSGHLQLRWPQRDIVLDLAIVSVEVEPAVDATAFRLRTDS